MVNCLHFEGEIEEIDEKCLANDRTNFLLYFFVNSKKRELICFLFPLS